MSEENAQKRNFMPEEFARAVRKFEKSCKQLASLNNEVGELSKKKPDGPINKFKLGFINGLLEDVNPFLGDTRPFEEFTSFDQDSVPTNSDVKMILSLYLASCLSKRQQDARLDPRTRKTFWYLDDEPVIEADSRDDRLYSDRYEEDGDEEDEESAYYGLVEDKL